MDKATMIGKRIKARRKIAGLTQVELAIMAGIQYSPAKDVISAATSTRLSNIENGKKPASKEEIEALARFLRCSTSWLLYGVWGTYFPHLCLDNKQLYAATQNAMAEVAAGKHGIDEMAKIIAETYGWVELAIKAHLRLWAHDEKNNKGKDLFLEV